MLLSYLEANRIEAGCDEAGRGCLAGSVYAAAVILPPDFHNEDLNDSKQLSERNVMHSVRLSSGRRLLGLLVSLRLKKSTGSIS